MTKENSYLKGVAFWFSMAMLTIWFIGTCNPKGAMAQEPAKPKIEHAGFYVGAQQLQAMNKPFTWNPAPYIRDQISWRRFNLNMEAYLPMPIDEFSDCRTAAHYMLSHPNISTKLTNIARRVSRDERYSPVYRISFEFKIVE